MKFRRLTTAKMIFWRFMMNTKIKWQSLSRIWLTLGFWVGVFVLEASTAADPERGEGLPIWLQILIPVAVALLIYFVIQGLIRRRNMNKEEIVFRKESGQIPETRSEIPEKMPQQEGDDWTFPQRDERTGQQIKLPKGVTWGMIVFAIAILRALSRCLAG